MPWTPSAPLERRWPEDHLLAPRRREDREALRVLLATRHSACAAKVSATNQLKALIVGAPEELRADQRRPGAGELVARWPAAFGGRVRGAGWRQPDPSLLRAGHQASAESLRGSAAQSRPAHGGGGPAARRPADPCLRARRRGEGKSVREIRRCLKRAVARQLFKLLLEWLDRPGVELVSLW